MIDLGTPIDAVVLFEVGDEELVRRISGRRTCSLCNKVFNVHTAPPATPATDCVPGSNEHQLFQRKDDEEATVAERLRVYANQTQPVLSYYSDAGLLRSVRAEGALEAITQRLLEVLAKKPARARPAPKKRAAKRRTVAKAKPKARPGKVTRPKAKPKKRRSAPKKRVAARKATRKVARKVSRKARPARRKSKRR
jgi:adenylate kinase